MIPVLGVPVLTRPELLYSMLGTVDADIERVYIVDNGGVVDLDRVCGDIYGPGRNLGVAASWNNIVGSNPDAPWWLIASFDIEFPKGALAQVEEHMRTVGGFAMLFGFTAFAFDAATFAKVGRVDENFHPAYFEDNDYARRLDLSGVPTASLDLPLVHHGSSTLRSSQTFMMRNHSTFPANRAYFVDKWGGVPGEEVFTTPFNAGGDISGWTLDEQRISSQSWT